MNHTWGRDPQKWVITKWMGGWHVFPPVGSFWGERTEHATGEEALSDFRRQSTYNPFYVDIP